MSNTNVEKQSGYKRAALWLPAAILIGYLLYSLWLGVQIDVVGLPDLVGALSDDLGNVNNRLIFYIMAITSGIIATLLCSVFLLLLLFRCSRWFHRLFTTFLWSVLLGSGVVCLLELYVFQLGGDSFAMWHFQLSAVALIAFVLYAAASQTYARVYRPHHAFKFDPELVEVSHAEGALSEQSRVQRPASAGPVGIGGWLIVPLLLFVLTLAFECVCFFISLPAFIGPLDIVNHISISLPGLSLAGFVPFVVGLFAMALFVKRNRWFPGVLALYFLVGVLSHWVSVSWYDLVLSDFIFALEDVLGAPQFSISLGLSLVELLSAILLALYLRFSKRVKNTFGRKVDFNDDKQNMDNGQAQTAMPNIN